MIQNFSASGKLLLFGEYLVLRGGRSIAIPLRFGQKLSVRPHNSESILWEAFEHDQLWLHLELSPKLEILSYHQPNTSSFNEQTGEKNAAVVQTLLRVIQNLGKEPAGNHFRFDINFDRNFGFGTSSTLISLLSQWSDADPYLLLEKTFGGSGYDIAAATAKGPVMYQILQPASGKVTRKIYPARIQRDISSSIIFVYTGKKQRSHVEVKNFNQHSVPQARIRQMNAIVDAVEECVRIDDFESLMDESEGLLSGILNISPVKNRAFSDYPHSVKSLGAWGGDFVMATFRDEQKARDYFRSKGMHPVFTYNELIKNG